MYHFYYHCHIHSKQIAANEWLLSLGILMFVLSLIQGDVSVHGLERYGSISTGGHRKPELDEGQKSIHNQKEDPYSISLGDTKNQKQKGKVELHGTVQYHTVK